MMQTYKCTPLACPQEPGAREERQKSAEEEKDQEEGASGRGG